MGSVQWFSGSNSGSSARKNHNNNNNKEDDEDARDEQHPQANNVHEEDVWCTMGVVGIIRREAGRVEGDQVQDAGPVRLGRPRPRHARRNHHRHRGLQCRSVVESSHSLPLTSSTIPPYTLITFYYIAAISSPSVATSGPSACTYGTIVCRLSSPLSPVGKVYY